MKLKVRGAVRSLSCVSGLSSVLRGLPLNFGGFPLRQSECLSEAYSPPFCPLGRCRKQLMARRQSGAFPMTACLSFSWLLLCPKEHAGLRVSVTTLFRRSRVDCFGIGILRKSSQRDCHSNNTPSRFARAMVRTWRMGRKDKFRFEKGKGFSCTWFARDVSPSFLLVVRIVSLTRRKLRFHAPFLSLCLTK